MTDTTSAGLVDSEAVGGGETEEEFDTSFLERAANEEDLWRSEGHFDGRRAKAFESSHTMREASRLGATMGARLGRDAGESAGSAGAWQCLAIFESTRSTPFARSTTHADPGNGASSAVSVDTAGAGTTTVKVASSQGKRAPSRRRLGGRRARAVKAAATALRKVDSLGLRGGERGRERLAEILNDREADVQGILDAARDAAKPLRANGSRHKAEQRERLSF